MTHQEDRYKQAAWIKFALDFIHKYGMEEFKKLLQTKLDIKFDMDISCLWRIWELNFEKKHEALTRAERFALIKAGRIEKRLAVENFNKIMNVYKSAIIANNIGSPTSAQNLGFDYVLFGTKDVSATTGEVPAVTRTTLYKERYRTPPDEKYESSGSTIVLAYLDATEANLTGTTVASGASTTQFNVQAGQGANYVAGDLIRVFLTSWETVTVLSVSTDTITLKPSTPLSATPTAGMAVERGWGEVGLACGDATGATDSGTLVNLASLPHFKNNVTSTLVEINMNYLTSA